MRIHPVVVASLDEGEAVVLGDEAHHLAKVLRVRPGDEVRAFDGSGHEALGTVTAVERSRVVLELAAPYRSPVEVPDEVTLAVALLKANKLADVVRMGTELGVARFVWLDTVRTERADVSAAKRQRLDRVAREAAKQSGRARIPDIDGPVDVDALALAPRTFVADPRADVDLGSVLRSSAPGDGPWMIVTGPEGGFEPSEVDALAARGATPVRLGRSVMRAETAPVAIAAVLMAAIA